jgi:hypothetical protein
MRTVLLCCIAIAPLLAHAETDACTLLTSSQVGAVAGVTVGEGTHVTPTFVKTCTWTPSAKSKVSAVTLNLQAAAMHDGSKQQIARMAVMSPRSVAVKPASVGEDAFYSITGDQPLLFVKKGGASFKVAVYAKLPQDEKEAMELQLAREVVGKL